MKVLKRAYFRPPKNNPILGPKKRPIFQVRQKRPYFRPQKRDLILGPKKRPKNGRFLGLEKAVSFRHRRH